MEIKSDFVKLIKENEGIIFKVTTFYTNNEHDQNDLYQEIVYQLWKSFDSFRNESKISTWMYRVALNTSITYLKKQKRRGTQVPIDRVILNKTDWSNSLHEEMVKTLYAQITKLNDLEKGIVLLYLEGNSYEEIANITGFTVTNVGTRLGRIKQKLKSAINK